MNDPGKYDEACTQARIATRAVGVLLVVIEGDKGTGFSVQTHDKEVLHVLPAILRLTADEIERENRRRAMDA
jgi:hypothetical protein